jgi:hypothetical protein
MSKSILLVAAMALTNVAQTHAQSADAETELARLVADCNGIAESGKPKRRSIRACETLAAEGRLSLVEPAAATAYQLYRQDRLEACRQRQASPRGASRGQSDCEP